MEYWSIGVLDERNNGIVGEKRFDALRPILPFFHHSMVPVSSFSLLHHSITPGLEFP
jgi:hypothetical protein